MENNANDEVDLSWLLRCGECQASVHVLYIPCGHLIKCKKCDQKLLKEECDKCHKWIEERVHIFF